MSNFKVTGDFEATGGGKLNGKEIVTIYEKGSGFIKYTDGTQVCYGFYDNGSYVGDKSGVSISFARPFISTPSLVMTSGKLDGSKSYRSTNCNFYSLSTTGAIGGWYGNTARCLTWVAYGRWK